MTPPKKTLSSNQLQRIKQALRRPSETTSPKAVISAGSLPHHFSRSLPIISHRDQMPLSVVRWNTIRIGKKHTVFGISKLSSFPGTTGNEELKSSPEINGAFA
jgi:hypothetical protein